LLSPFPTHMVALPAESLDSASVSLRELPRTRSLEA
jgi:hypothetical protein